MSFSMLVGCGSESPDPPAQEPEAETPAEREVEEPTLDETETSYQNRPTEAPVLVSASDQRTALRSARLATQEERYEEAFALFDQLLHSAPRARQVWCEAGFDLHKSGNNERAARFLDHGLALYPRGSALEETRLPLATCLYNRGLVHQAREEIGAARQRFRESIALRPSEVVQSALDALPEAGPVTSRFFAAESPAAFRLALSQAYAGFNNFNAHRSALPADVQLLGEVDVDGVLTEVLSVWTHSYPLAEEYLVAAFAVEGGFRITAFEVATRDETNHQHEGNSVVSALGSAEALHGLLHADVNILRSERFAEEHTEDEGFCFVTMKEPTLRTSYSLLCDVTSFECALLPKSEAVLSAGSVEADDCEGMPGVAALRPSASPSPWALRMTVESATQVRFVQESGTAFPVPTEQSVPWRGHSEILPVSFHR
ncbi:MAG: tetratricopeptide repeat protein [Polyangiales bacterium]